jgi:PKD repeat protein
MAAPVIPSESTIRSRNTGLLPLGVLFDASGTTGGTDPFHNLFYRWNFGDDSTETWTYGSNTASSKNGAFGPIAAHVYKTAGTFTWTLIVSNSAGESSITSGTITVSDWANDANTICVGNVLPVAGVNGVPTNATCVQSADFNGAIFTHLRSGTTKRMLFKRGDTFDCSFQAEPTTTGGVYIGAYGTGAAPIVDITGNCPAVSLSQSDYRILDLYIDGNAGASSRGVQVAAAAGAVAQITVLNNTITDVQHGVILRERTADLEDQVFVVGNEITDTNNFCVYPQTTTKFAMLGNNIAAKTGASGVHDFRAEWIKVGVISNNTMSKASASCHNIKLHGPDYDVVTDFTEEVVISENSLPGGNNGSMVNIEPQNDLIDERLRNIIFENNYIPSGAAGDTPVRISGAKITARNNILDFTGGPAGNYSCFYVLQRGEEPVPDEIWIYNNTAYNPVANAVFRFLRMDDSPTNVLLRNNLGYSPNTTTVEVSTGTGGAGSAQSNNSTAAGVSDGIKVNPQFDGPLTTPLGFAIAVASYGTNGGTAVFPATSSDFFNGRDSAGSVRIGAIVPRDDAQCTGVAQ